MAVITDMDIKEQSQGFSVSDKTVCLVGCGGLGCNIAVHLVGAGIGKLYICDFDTVSESNLNRQFLYTKDDVGKCKVLKAKERLQSYGSDTEIIAVDKKIENRKDLFFAKDSDIVILAVDNAEARITVQNFCDETDIPLVCGGIDGFYGVCYLYIPKVSPCPECAGLNAPARAKYNISSAAGIIGSLQTNLALRYLLTKDKGLSGKLTVFDETDFSTLNIKASAECLLCKQIHSRGDFNG